MPADVVALASFAVVALLPGLPLSLLLLRRTTAGAAVIVTVGLGVGLVTWLLIGLPAVHLGSFDRATVATTGALISVAAWVPARRLVGRLRPGRPGWLAGWLALLAVPAVWLRSDPIYFAYQVADFGEYVNRGNVIADGGPFGGWFVNGFPLMMGEAHLLLGEASTVDVMPFLGLTLAASILALLHLAATGPVVIGATALVLTFHVHAVWFSVFPASETLYAMLLALSMLLGVAALRGQDHLTAVAGGSVGFLLVVTRGNGLVYLPVVVAGLVLVPILTDAVHHRVLRVHLTALGLALWFGTLYDARYNPAYFLEEQAGQRLPSAFADWFLRIDEPRIGAGFTVVVAIGLAGATGVGVVVSRVAAAGGRVALLRRVTLAVLVAGVLAVHAARLLPDAYVPRYEALGFMLWVSVALAVAVWAWRADDRLDGVTRFAVSWPLVTGAVMGTFQATRMRKSVTVDAPWFLYWDRYFFSEAFPMLLVAGACAAGVVVSRARRSDRRWVGPGLAVAGVLIVALGTVDMAGPTRKAREQPMFDEAYEELASLDALMDEALPIVYDGLRAERPEGWFWSNSGRVIADPLVQTFGRKVLNPAPATGADPQPTAPEVAGMLHELGVSDGYVLQASPDGQWPDLPGRQLDVEVVGEQTIRFERLDGRSRLRPEAQAWVISDLHLRVLRVSTAGARV
jgi:hypothetical protein